MSHICNFYGYICSRNDANWKLKKDNSRWLRRVRVDQSESTGYSGGGALNGQDLKQYFEPENEHNICALNEHGQKC